MTDDDREAGHVCVRACRRFRVRGHVQGVFFRGATRAEAVLLGLDGHAVNLDDGSVEVLARGAPEALERLERWLAHGPPLARVDSVQGVDCEAVLPAGFTTG